MEQQNVVQVALYQPHEAQLLLHESNARFRIAACGRRFGKSLACANELLKFALENKEVRCVWVSPIWKQTRLGAEPIVKALRGTSLLAGIKRANGEIAQIRLANESTIEFASSAHPDNIRGFSHSFAVIDEAAYVPRSLWEDVLRPTLADTQGRAIFVSTPFGRNYFWELFTLGQDPKNKKYYESFHFPTAANPYIPKNEIEQARLRLPEDVYRQEWEAAFLESGAGVFRKIFECVGGMLIDKGIPDRHYVVGVDFAKQTDFTVLIVMDREAHQVVYFDRFNKIDWQIQLNRVQSVSRKFNHAKVIMDATGLGDPLYEQMRQRGASVTGYSLNSLPAKNRLIENLSALMEETDIRYPEIPELMNEMQMYQYNISDKTGKITYGAPERQHDDCVIALALAAWGCKGRKVFEQFRQNGVSEEEVGLHIPTTEEYVKKQLSWRWNPYSRTIEY